MLNSGFRQRRHRFHHLRGRLRHEKRSASVFCRVEGGHDARHYFVRLDGAILL